MANPSPLLAISTAAVTSHAPRRRGRARKGQIYYSTIDDSYDVQPRKAAFRILTWERGTFELEAPDEKAVLEEIQESTEQLLMEGMRQLDEYRRIEPDLPGKNEPLSLVTPLTPPLRDLDAGELDVLQLVINQRSLAGVLDGSTKSDYETAQTLLGLIQRGYVKK